MTQFFVYNHDVDALYIYGARAGRAYDIVVGEQVVRACFTTSEMRRYILIDQPVNLTVKYAGLVAYGLIELVKTPAQMRAILERFMPKFAPHLVPEADYDEIAELSVD